MGAGSVPAGFPGLVLCTGLGAAAGRQGVWLGRSKNPANGTPHVVSVLAAGKSVAMAHPLVGQQARQRADPARSRRPNLRDCLCDKAPHPTSMDCGYRLAPPQPADHTGQQGWWRLLAGDCTNGYA